MALLPLVVFALLAVLFLVQLLSGKDTSQVPSALIDKPAPEFTCRRSRTCAAATARQFPEWRARIFWARSAWSTSSPPGARPAARSIRCWRIWPDLDKAQMIGINYKDKPENARRFLGTLGNPYERVGADDKGRAAIDWGVYGVPETFIVDAAGTIRYKFIGPLSPESYRDVFLPELDKILATPNG
jgi:cytochrome c biogenesis protein CcmG/thiol:disulfide interchange protein DsbE